MDDHTRLARRTSADVEQELAPAPSPAYLVTLYAPGDRHYRPADRVKIGPTEASVGRETGNTVDFSAPTVSKFHARISPENGAWTLSDLRSRNGTWVNGEPIHAQTLRSGDTVRFGRVLTRFLCGPTAEVDYLREVHLLHVTDPRTGASARVFVEEAVETELARMRALGGKVTFALLEIDGFKDLSASLGTLAGDEAMAHAAKHIRDGLALRPWETLGAADDGQFGLLLPGTDPLAASDRLDAAVRALAAVPYEPQGATPTILTFSAGVAAAESQYDGRQFQQAAAGLLVDAKRQGKGSIEVGVGRQA